MLLTYHLSSKLCTAAEPAPSKLRPGRTFLKGRNLCGGFRPFFLWQGESGPLVRICCAKGDASDRADRDDQLFGITVLHVHRQREEAVAGLAGDGVQREPLDLTVDPRDEVVERRLGRAGYPQVRAQKSLVPSSAAPTCRRPSSVTILPRGVRWRKPSWSRYGSYTSSIVSGSSPSATASVERPTGPPPNLRTIAPSRSRSMRSRPIPSTSSRTSASRATAFVITPSCLTCATSRTRLRIRFAILGVPRERRAISSAASSSISTSRMRADLLTMVPSSPGS